MKRKICFIVFLLSSFTMMAQQQLPNGGFENWASTVIFESLSDWTCGNSENVYGNPGFSKSEDAYSGDYSVKLQPYLNGEDTSFSYFYHGEIIGDGPGAGIPYSESFDGIGGYYKSDLAEHDSAVIMLVKFLNTVPTFFATKIGGVASEWTQFYFDVPPGACDSVFVGFISSDIFLETVYSFDSWIMFDSIYFTNSLGEDPDPELIPNHDLENWFDVEFTDPQSWHTLNSYFTAIGVSSVVESDDVFEGGSAAELVTSLVMGEYIISGYLSLGEIFLDDDDPVRGIPYTDKPSKFKGYYKYYPQETDIAVVQVMFSDDDVTVGGGDYAFVAASEYTYFEVELNYDGDPDTLTLVFSSGSIEGSRLLLDNISFDFEVNVADQNANKFTVYPNPANDILFVSFNQQSNSTLQITDISGRLLKEEDCNAHAQTKIDCSDLVPGIYFISDKTTGVRQQFVVAR
ncbi:MAG: T9SS type A sorting domain-containing protein [Bacteroidales bacterium]|nr:T9SS type A sorting domain-containing protein [Bacteroidales bacterium]